MDRRTFLMTSLAALASTRSRARTDEVALLQGFLKRPKESQQKLLGELKRQVAGIESPWLGRVRELTDSATKLLAVKAQGISKLAPHHEEPSPFCAMPFAFRTEYLWGHRAVRALESRTPLVARFGKESLVLPFANAPEDLLAMLRGLPPDLDLALAGAMAALDQSSAVDKFALFLESWRNGQESFYRALDRSAGTKEAVFYFDAMLGEFQARFAPKGTPGAEQLKSLKQLHDALHDAFLVYRQYRGLREAAACVAVFPPSLRLPKCLERYDSQRVGYALRDDLLILARIDGQDPLPGLRMIADSAGPLPSPLWSTQGKYDALLPFQKAFEGRLARTIENGGENTNISSDAMLAAEVADRQRTATKVTELAHAALSGA